MPGVQLFRCTRSCWRQCRKGALSEEQLSLLNRDVERTSTHLLQQDDAPTLSFGATLTIGEYVMPGLIGRHLEQHPRHHLSMIVDNTATLTGLIQKGKIDFALIEGDFNQSQLGFEKLSDEPFIGICAAESPLWRRTAASLFHPDVDRSWPCFAGHRGPGPGVAGAYFARVRRGGWRAR